jgi:hypothetical protein
VGDVLLQRGGERRRPVAGGRALGRVHPPTGRGHARGLRGIGSSTPGRTIVEKATRAWPEKTIPQSHAQLRGYSWATLLPPELVGELGGIGALRASDAFHGVDELGYGAAWLQSTAEFGDYDEAASRRMFEVLAPVLIDGTAERSFSKFHPPLAYDVNADDYRRENA